MTRRDMLEKLLAAAAAGAIWPTLAFALDWKPLFLNTQQSETLAALSESIVPGSSKTQVSRFIDLLLTVDTPDHQQAFVASLTEIEHATEARYRRTFPSLIPNEKDELLANLSSDPAQQKSFNHLKEWITLAYYSSEDGMRELGWTGQHGFRQFPTCP